MCTVTIVPRPGGVRVVCNRDEQRTRATALAAGEQRVDGQRAWFPVDPESGGTWIGVNARGLVAALLNRTPVRPAAPLGPRRAATTSRGLIVPHVLRAASIHEALSILQALRFVEYAPFTLVLWHAGTLSTAVGGGAAAPQLSLERLRSPVMFASSSLGDAVVQRPRQALFLELLECHSGDPLTAQKRFHEHVWPRHPEISVLMSRRDARTVSRTRIDLNMADERIGVHYEPIPDDREWAKAC